MTRSYEIDKFLDGENWECKSCGMIWSEESEDEMDNGFTFGVNDTGVNDSGIDSP